MTHKSKFKIGTRKGNVYYTWAKTPTIAALNIWHKYKEIANEFFRLTEGKWEKTIPN